jgi:hypothetical protein
VFEQHFPASCGRSEHIYCSKQCADQRAILGCSQCQKESYERPQVELGGPMMGKKRRCYCVCQAMNCCKLLLCCCFKS